MDAPRSGREQAWAATRTARSVVGAGDMGAFQAPRESRGCASPHQIIAMNRAIAANRLRRVIDRVFPFDKVVDAFHHYESAHPFGKVVISQK